jgi:hypothetical protein
MLSIYVKRFTQISLACLLLEISAHGAEPPGIINHQGRISVDGVNHNGPGFFKFSLVNETGEITFWSNDGSSVAGSAPATAIESPVASGHYSVPLGDTTYHAKMNNAIPKEVFSENTDVRLCIWFSTDNTTFQKLTPNRRIASAAYALSSGAAGSAASGSIGSEEIADGSITGIDILAGSIGASHLGAASVNGNTIEDGAISTMDLADSSVTSAKILDGTILSADISAGAIISTLIADNAISGAKIASGSITSSHIAAGAITADLIEAGSITGTQIQTGTISSTHLAADSVTGDKIADGSITKANLSAGIGVWDAADGNIFRLSGNVGIGTATPTDLFEIHGDAILGAETLDQEALTPSTVVPDLLWQSFTSGSTGQLTRLELKVGTPLSIASSSGTIKLYAGEGTSGDLLASQSVTFAVVAFGSYQSFTLTSPIQVTEGEKYTIGIEVPERTFAWIFVDTSNTYAGGAI